MASLQRPPNNAPGFATKQSPRQTGWQPAAIAGLGAILVWAYWPTLCEIVDRWVNDSRYSHGYFVPIFALWFCWSRRRKMAGVSLAPCGWGFALLGLGLTLHLIGARCYIDFLCASSFIISLAGICLGLGGWKALRWAGPSIAFLVFMLPLPFSVEMALAHPLQRVATEGSTYLLQMLGLPAVAEGNIIIMEESKIGVEEACNGLGMLVTFFALATGVAMVLNRPLLDKFIVVASAIPVALAANIVRIVVTGLLGELFGGEAASHFYHNLAGLFLMPLALAMLWVELLLLSRLLVDVPSGGSASFQAAILTAGSKKKMAILAHKGDSIS